MTSPPAPAPTRPAPLSGTAPDVRLVALDIDGTILEPGQRISDGVIRALRDLAAAGVRCATATGRPLRFQLELLARHGLGGAGQPPRIPHALMVDERELFLLHPPDGAGADAGGRPKPRGSYRPHAAWNGEVRRRWQELHPLAMSWLARAEAEARRRGWPVRGHLDEADAYERGLPTLALEQPEHAAALCDWLAPELAAGSRPLACNRNVRLLQIQDAAAGKGKTLAELARIWDLRPDQVLAIGDSANDYSMLNGVLGFRCATVGNADEAIKAAVRHAGGYVAAGRIGAGVVEILEPLLRRLRS